MTYRTTLPARTETSSPPWALLGVEPLRALLEYASLHFAPRSEHPPGDGHAVVMFPGLASDKMALGPLMSFCRNLGYEVHDWGRGFNTGPQGDAEAWLDDLAIHVGQLSARAHEPISLVGWSLGGIYAREVAKRLDRRVRQVVTIGTPFAGTVGQTNAGMVYRLLNGQKASESGALLAQLSSPPSVPTTSIYSRSDGVVAWQACIQHGDAAHTENVEVQGSHCGMGWNTQVLKVLANRLGQAPGAWSRYGPAS